MRKIKTILLIMALVILPLKELSFCTKCNHYHFGEKCTIENCECKCENDIIPQRVDKWPKI